LDDAHTAEKDLLMLANGTGEKASEGINTK